MSPIDQLLSIMRRLRTLEGGCPWDLEQTFATIAPYTIEEAYEVADAIDHGDMLALKDELGDLLFQVVFHARMAEEQGHFVFDDVVQTICDKMVRRHHHVFSTAGYRDATEQTIAWETTKADERAAKGTDSVLDGIARTLPPMTRALKLQSRAARVGFDWTEVLEVIDKIDEELAEIKHEISIDAERERIEDEMGDLLFACVNLARKLTIDPERSLKRASAKFDRRFRHIESELKLAGRRPEQATLEEMEALWRQAKHRERPEGGEQ
jgi:ATP diphosphatase